MNITISEAIKQLLLIVNQLCDQYPQKKFTLDGRLVGDLGEILVENVYDLVLYPKLHKHHDGKTQDGRLVQIKATMKNILTFPVDHTPDYYLGIKIHSDGTFTEVFNGPGHLAGKAVKDRKPTKTNLHCIPIKRLAELSETVSAKDRIPKRSPAFPDKPSSTQTLIGQLAV